MISSLKSPTWSFFDRHNLMSPQERSDLSFWEAKPPVSLEWQHRWRASILNVPWAVIGWQLLWWICIYALIGWWACRGQWAGFSNLSASKTSECTVECSVARRLLMWTLVAGALKRWIIHHLENIWELILLSYSSAYSLQVHRSKVVGCQKVTCSKDTRGFSLLKSLACLKDLVGKWPC